MRSTNIRKRALIGVFTLSTMSLAGGATSVLAQDNVILQGACEQVTFEGVDGCLVRNPDGTLGFYTLNGTSTNDGNENINPGDDGICRLERNGPWSYRPKNPNDLYEIEVQGQNDEGFSQDGDTHMDFWVPLDGLVRKAVSYITPGIVAPDGPMKWDGLGGGSWEITSPACADWDFPQDTANYAASRVDRDSNHSGLSFDVRDPNNPVLVANVCGLSVDQINRILDAQQQYQRGDLSFQVSDNTPTHYPDSNVDTCPNGTTYDNGSVNGSDDGNSGECDSTRFDVNPVVDKTWSWSKYDVPEDAYVIGEIWSNQIRGDWPKPKPDQRKVILQPGERPELQVGGAFYAYPFDCGDVVAEEFGSNPWTEISVFDLMKLQRSWGIN